MNEADLQAVARWLVDGARSAATSEAVLEELCQRLLAGGLPLARVAVFVRTLHPELMGRRFLWQSGAGVTASTGPLAVMKTAEYLDSPIAWVYANRRTLRRRLADPACPIDWPMLADLKAEGMTDYLATPLLFTDGAVHGATWSTRQAQGFTDGQVAAIEAIVPALARVAEVRALRRTATNLLDTYVGHHAGERILAGQILRGHAERINAAIWLSDMRGFTTLSDRLPAETLIGLLNDYFDCQVPAILEQGGEVLKFMGDGLLAIFATDAAEEQSCETCARALAAARKARAKIAELATADRPAGSFSFGLALHLGEVLYGNIGGASRLDFTCIGPAVNLAARLEKLAGGLGRTILASEEFASRCAGGLIPIGAHRLAGFAEPRLVFGLAEEGSHAAAAV